MATVLLVARREFPYAGHTVVAGEVFIAQSDQDAWLFKAIGHAIDIPPHLRYQPDPDHVESDDLMEPA